MAGCLHRSRLPVLGGSGCHGKVRALHAQIAVLPARRVQRTVWAHAASSATEAAPKGEKRPGEKKGFVEEMRFVAMKLHTKDQAPKEGGKEASQHPMRQWQPTRQGYLNFLAESKQVYDTLEQIVAEAPSAELAEFRNTGLERAEALARDIAFFKQEYGLEPSPINEDGPGMAYSRLLQKLAKENPQAFLCHFYNIYFAHTAGGRMIGTKVASMILDNRTLEFYKYDGDYKPLLENVRDRLNKVADNWTREQKDKCLEETEMSFKYSGGLLQLVAT